MLLINSCNSKRHINKYSRLKESKVGLDCVSMMSLRVKQSISCLLLLVSIVIVCDGIANNYSVGDYGGPIPSFFILISALLLLSINEGYQTALISSRSLDISHFPRAQRVKTLIFCNNGSYDRLPRLFLGQSFMVISCTFLVSSLTIFTKWPQGWLDIFTRGGLAGVMVCVNLAQLLPSMWSTRHPAEYLNSTPVIGPVVSGALFIESIGLFHFTFIFVRFLEMIFGQDLDSPDMQWQWGVRQSSKSIQHNNFR